MAKFTTGRIAFADPPPGQTSALGMIRAVAAQPTGGPSSHPPPQASHPTLAHQRPPGPASPRIPNPDAVALPDIADDSEDDDASNNSFMAPSWANSPVLREILAQQQLLDPESIFGPIAPLQMEEIFRSPGCHHRFRNRTSSANWSSADRITEEERRRDREARERIVRDGAWTLNNASIL